MNLRLEIFVGLYCIHNLHCDVTNTTGIVGVENRDFSIANGFVVKEKLQIKIDDLVLQEQNVDSSGLESSVDAKSMVGDFRIVHRAVGIAGRVES